MRSDFGSAIVAPMAHIGVLCLPVPSHLNLFLVLSKTLLSRGHRVTFFGIPEVKEKIIAAGPDFVRLEPESVPTGTISSLVDGMGNARGHAAVKMQRRFDELRSLSILGEGPSVISRALPDVLVVDQTEPAGGSVAEKLALPWVTVCSALCLNWEARIPPFFTTWSYAESSAAVIRNQLAYAAIRRVTRSAQNLINGYRRSWGLRPARHFADTFSPYAQICQQIPEFDFPRTALPNVFHYVGPIRFPAGPKCDFPWDRLDSRPIIYASLGTLVNQHRHIYQIIAEACAGLKAQLVVSLGGGAEPEEYRDLPGDPLVVKFAPQRELLAGAALTITHAGLNTTLESLCEGVPLVAIPIACEQPGIAARIRWTGTGDFLPPSRLSASRLRSMIEQVLGNPKYRNAARRMRDALHPVQGSTQAAEIIETVIRTKQPVRMLEKAKTKNHQVGMR